MRLSRSNFLVGIGAIILPIILLIKGIYGSFIFTFSIPLLWEVVFKGKPISSLGLKKESFPPALIWGIVSGLSLALIGGSILNLVGLEGFCFSPDDELKFSLGYLKISFSLENELGYRLLTQSNTLLGTILYLAFSIFLIGLGEEMFWRGFIQKNLSRYFSSTISVWFTAILFSAIHFYLLTVLPLHLGIFIFSLIACAGAFLGYLFVYFDNLWGPAVCHGIVAFIVWKHYLFNQIG